MDTDELHRRLEKLEIDAAWQARTLTDLDEVVRGLADVVQRMEAALARLEASAQLGLREEE
jgi:uncharacterized coiled-coil protein SlyX